MVQNQVKTDVRVHSRSYEERIEAAAKSAASFIRKQVEAERPADKDELARGIWTLYFQMYRAGILAAPKTTRKLLRERYGFWGDVGVTAKWPSGH